MAIRSRGKAYGQIVLTTAALWKTYPPHENYGILPNVHKQAVLDIAYSLDSEVIYSVRFFLNLA